MKILYIGSVELSKHVLEKVMEIGGDIVGVCCLRSSIVNSDFVDLSECVIEKSIPFKYVVNINSPDTIDWIRAIGPDIIFCFGWSQLLKKELLSMPTMGVVGYHPAALPANRGRHPIIWALVLGLKKTASTFFFMNDGVDSGEIISQEDITIEDQDDAESLYKKIIAVAQKQIEELLPLLISGNYSKIQQNNFLSNIWRKRTRDDGIIDWRMSSQSVYNLVRALSKPYPGAEFMHHENTVKVWKAEPVNGDYQNVEPGKVIEVIDSIYPIIKCGEGAIKLLRIEPSICFKKGDYL